MTRRSSPFSFARSIRGFVPNSVQKRYLKEQRLSYLHFILEGRKYKNSELWIHRHVTGTLLGSLQAEIGLWARKKTKDIIIWHVQVVKDTFDLSDGDGHYSIEAIFQNVSNFPGSTFSTLFGWNHNKILNRDTCYWDFENSPKISKTLSEF